MNQPPDDWQQFIRSAQPVIAGSVARTLRRWSHPAPDQIDRLTEQVLEQLHNQLAVSQENGPAWLRAFASAAALEYLRAETAQNRALEQSERTLLFGRMARSLGSEDDRARWIFWLYYRHGLTPEAIAEIPALAVSPAAVDQVIDRLAQLTGAEEHADFLRADGPGAAEPSCLGPADIARTVTANETTGLEELFDHIADCDRCGSLLHDSLPGPEPVGLAALRTSSAEWQDALAQRWSAVARIGWLDAARSLAKRLTHPEPAPKRVVRVQSADVSGGAAPPKDPPSPRARPESSPPPARPAETEPGSA
jgi:hypothetical protein